MGNWRKLLLAAVGAAILVVVGTIGAAAEPRDRLIEFDSMAPIGTGAPTARELAGGGLPWMITSGSGMVDHQGDVNVKVQGLVLAAGPLAGTDPLPFAATVSCVTPTGIVNVTTASVATTSTGDATIDTTVVLPHPCKSPEVFVGAMIGGHFRWFAVSNIEEAQD